MIKNKLYNTEEKKEKVILIGIDYNNNEFDVNSCIDELEELAETAGAVIVGRMIQKREGIHRAHYFGKGKMEELKAYIDEVGATGIICDDELTANQIKNMEDILNTKIMNRTMVILDIFASRAKSAEGKVQIELAQLKYNLSHLAGQGKSMSRLGGGIGTRGPGEKKLETDRRNISDRISELSNELKNIERHRQVLREKRMKNSLPIVALVGYTNAGKSTLMNKITNAGVIAENKLFATLDTTTRKIELPSGGEYLFTDTVGFIQKLPHSLIQAFKATLEEVKYADILIHIVDASNSAREMQMNVVYKTLKELECENKPIITVFNKIDKDVERPLPNDDFASASVQISAKNGTNIDYMIDKVESIVKSFKREVSFFIPYNRGNLINTIYGNSEIIEKEHMAEGIFIKAYVNDETKNRLKDFIFENA